MKPVQIIRHLETNRGVFQSLLSDKEEDEYRWKPDEKSWSLLEIVCHPYDEEREDFRARVKNTLFTPHLQPSSIDPPGWVISRKYAEQDYKERLAAFLSERNDSIEWLKSLQNPVWENTYHHPALGAMTANMFLVNWLAHDYHHIRQINRRLYEYLKNRSGENLSYAGDW